MAPKPAPDALDRVSHLVDQASHWFDTLKRRWEGARPLPVWYHEAYRLPLPDAREATGIEPRRADLVLWALLGAGNRHLLDVHQATRIAYGDLGRVHTLPYLESLTRPASLAAVFGMHATAFPVDAVLTTVRLAAGGTLAATRYVLEEGGPALNLLGGFHHAFPDRGGGLCPVNDLAVALAIARDEGFAGQVVILDLDAHPPDGTAECVATDAKCWVGSLSGSDWGPLVGVDESVLPGADDDAYLAALDALLARAPRPDLAFVIAGGDVLAQDRFGLLSLSERGAMTRDARIAAWLDDIPSVWVPGGGYRVDAWRVLANTAVALMGPSATPIPPGMDPVASRFAFVSSGLHPDELSGSSDDDDEPWFSQEDMDALFGGEPTKPRLLNYYTVEGIEVALSAFGFLRQLRRLGYRRFQVHIERSATGDRAWLSGEADGRRHLLWEMVVDLELLDGERMLFLNWMTMRHPLGTLPPGRAPLPGQDAPGLGMAEEAMQLLMRVCERLDLAGIVLRPAWFHTAYMSRSRFHFLDPSTEADFQGVVRDLGAIGLPALSQAIADGRVLRDGAPWSWPAEPMVAWRDPPPDRSPPEPCTARFTLA